MQLLIRRPETKEFVSIAAPANRFDFSYLAPCQPSDLFIHGDLDRVAPLKEVVGTHEKAANLRGRRHRACRPASGQPLLRGQVQAADFGSSAYLDKRLGEPARVAIPARATGPP